MKEKVVEMFERLGEAVSSGDLKTISASYGYPALILSDEQVIVIEAPDQIEGSFDEGRKWYIERGILTTKHELLKFDPISEHVIAGDVRWPGFDEDGNENYTETSHYMIHIEDGKPLIRVAGSRAETKD